MLRIALGYPIVEKNSHFPTSDSKLHNAILQNDLAAIKAEISIGADLRYYDHVLGNPICLAVANSRLEILELLLSQGINPNVFDTIQRVTPLHIAAFLGCRESVQLLLKYGAMHAYDRERRTPGTVALLNDHMELALMLNEDFSQRFSSRLLNSLTPYNLFAPHCSSSRYEQDEAQCESSGFTQMV